MILWMHECNNVNFGIVISDQDEDWLNFGDAQFIFKIWHESWETMQFALLAFSMLKPNIIKYA